MFDFLSEALESNSFRRYNKQKARYLGAMLISLFEIVAVGVGKRLLEGGDLPNPVKFVAMHRSLWEDENLKRFVGSGVRTSTRLPQTMKFARRWLEECK